MRISYVCLIYKSVKYLQFLYNQFNKYTKLKDGDEFYFLAANSKTEETGDKGIKLIYNDIQSLNFTTDTTLEDVIYENTYSIIINGDSEIDQLTIKSVQVKAGNLNIPVGIKYTNRNTVVSEN